MEQTRCVTCRATTPSYQLVSVGSIEHGYRDLCCFCHNAEVAKRYGLDQFDNRRFEPLQLSDARGQMHEFHFSPHLFMPGIALSAIEIRDGQPAGYSFQVIGDPRDDSLILLARLIEKMKRALALKHLETDKHSGLGIADMTVRARIESDADEAPRLPMLIIDGQEITWAQFGQMLMSFEGFQFKLQIRDLSAEN